MRGENKLGKGELRPQMCSPNAANTVYGEHSLFQKDSLYFSGTKQSLSRALNTHLVASRSSLRRASSACLCSSSAWLADSSTSWACPSPVDLRFWLAIFGLGWLVVVVVVVLVARLVADWLLLGSCGPPFAWWCRLWAWRAGATEGQPPGSLELDEAEADDEAEEEEEADELAEEPHDEPPPSLEADDKLASDCEGACD